VALSQDRGVFASDAQADELPQESRVFEADVERSSPAGIATRAKHVAGEEVPPGALMSSEHFLGIVERMAAVVAGGCTVHVDLPG
jgi:hypothetical protein